MAHHLAWLEAAGAGLLQGVGLVFPIGGLGHAVLVAALGRSAATDIAPAASGYLFALLRLAVGVALVAYLWRDWLRVLRGLVCSTWRARSLGANERWAWRVVVAVVPGCVGMYWAARYADPLLHHPVLAGLLLGANGAVLLGIWWWWRRSPRAGGLSGTHRAPMSGAQESAEFAVEIAHLLPLRRALVLGVLPVAAVVPGLSGVGLAIAAGLLWGLTHEQAARLALLVAAPLYLTWGLARLPSLGAASYDGVRTPTVVGAAVALVTAILAAWGLIAYFRRASLRPFGYYCVVAGVAAAIAVGRGL